MEQEDQGGKFVWFVVGTLIGAGCALLYAPQSGRDTRKFLSKKTQEGREVVTDTTRDLLDKGKEVYEKGKEVYDKGRQVVDDAAALFERGRKLVRG